MCAAPLNFKVEGHGPPLLLVHGFGISFDIWENLLPHLQSHFTVIMIELPGIGASPGPERGPGYLDQAAAGIEAVRSALGLERWHILGYSTGTRVIERYLQTYPTRVTRAVFLCPLRLSAWKTTNLARAIQLDARLPLFGDWILSGARLKFLIVLLGFNLKSNPLVAAWHGQITSQPVAILKETLRSLAALDHLSFQLPENLPALFVWGRDDIIVDAPRAPAQQDVFITATHSAPQTAAPQTLAACVPFLLTEQIQEIRGV